MMIFREFLTIGGIFIAGIVFMTIRNKLKGGVIPSIKTNLDDKTKEELKDLYDKGLLSFRQYAKKLGREAKEVLGNLGLKERFDIHKFGKMFDLTDGVEWIKSIKEILDLRKLVVYGVIISCIFGYGWYRGVQGQPIKVDIGYGKEAMINLDDKTNLHIDKTGLVYLEDKQGNKIKQISVSDIDGLKRKLAPIGFQLQPIFVAGAGFGNDGLEQEVGFGVSWLRFWKARADVLLTQHGIYPIAVSYKITEHSGSGLALGKGWKGDSRVFWYYKFEF